jgi:ADP-dependent NAD(P)H-hydrate dehydratase / NAD(P)H-hydrate epimerase
MARRAKGSTASSTVARVSALHPWLSPLYTAEEMRAIDRWAIEERGIPSLELMESAGTGVAGAVSELEPNGPVRIVCGKGNNGGDGLVAARKLAEHGVETDTLMLWGPDELSPDARANHDRLASSGGTARVIEAGDLPGALAGSGVVVDALLGTGFTGKPRPPLDAAIEAINGCAAPVVAVDVPSGVDASTGEVEGACVDADLTVTFHAAKLGLWVLPGKERAGHVEVIEIGIPDEEGGPLSGFTAGLIEPQVLDLVPPRGIGSTKFSSGSVLVIGGSRGLTGAPCMTSEAAMRAGAGWVRAAVPASLEAIFEQKLTEAMTVALPDENGSLTAAAEEQVLEAVERADAVALGPGFGRAKRALALARALAAEVRAPLLIDADGLNALGKDGLETLRDRDCGAVLTPHSGELARLLDVESREVAAHRLRSAREAAARADNTVVLKGDDSLIVDGERTPIAVSPGGSPALATAGTGDVLSGVIAAFLSKGLPEFEAACAGVYAHSQAGWIAGAEFGVDSVIASDVIAAVPAALRRPAEPAGSP